MHVSYHILQVEDRALEVWGTEEAIEAEREKREEKKIKSKKRTFDKMIKGWYLVLLLYTCTVTPQETTDKKYPCSLACYTRLFFSIVELRMNARSSLGKQIHSIHQHDYTEEEYDEDGDMYSKKCKTCDHVNEYEKM